MDEGHILGSRRWEGVPVAKRSAGSIALAVVCLVSSLLLPLQQADAASPKRYQDDHPWVSWGGAWTWKSSPNLSGHSSRTSQSAGAWASVVFTGSAAAVVSQTGPDKGHMKVLIDGRSVATVSLFSTSTVDAVTVWNTSGLKKGKHTLKVVVTGGKDAQSSGAWIDIDAFEFDGPFRRPKYPGVRVQNGDAHLYQKGPWRTKKRKDAFGGSVVRTAAKDASVTLRFKGTGVTWWGRKDPTLGDAEVWLDGKKVATVSQYHERPVEPRAVWAVRSLKNKTHTLVIKNTGRPSVDGGGANMEFDAFQVHGTVITAPRPAPFKYKWKNYIVVDKSEFKLYLVKNKKLVRVYPIAHGKKHTPTPERVWRIDAKYHSDPRGIYGPRKMRLFKRVSTSRGYRYVRTSYLIHGTNQEWVIGTRASHGCIRMYNKDVRELFPQVPMGTIVVTRS